MSAEMLEKFQEANSDEERCWLVLQISLQTRTPEIQEAVWAAALPHWFNEEILAAILKVDIGKAEDLLETLKTLSFMEVFPGKGWNIHERARKLFLHHLWKLNRAHFQELSQRAGAYCSQLMEDNPVWRLEYIYHILIADPMLGSSELAEVGCKWLQAPNFAYDRVETLVRFVREHADAERLEYLAQGWMLLLEARLDNIHSRPQIALEKLLQISDLQKLERELLADQQKELGATYMCLSEYGIAEEHLTNALQFYRLLGNRFGEANCIHLQGEVCLNLSELNEANKHFAKAQNIYREIGDHLGEASCLRSQGTLHLYFLELNLAQKCYKEAQVIYNQSDYRLGEAHCLYDLGNLYTRFLEFDQAQIYYEEALPIFKKIDNPQGEASCLKALGDAFLDKKDYKLAQKYLFEAKQHYLKIGNQLGELNCIKSLGNVYLAEENYEAAQNFFKKALQYSLDKGWSDYIAEMYNRLAAMYIAQEKYSTALECFNQAIVHFSTNPIWFCNRAYLYLIMRQLDLAATDIENANNLIPNHPYVVLRQGDLASLQKDFTSAIEYYQRVLLIIPRLSSPWYGIGRIHLRTGHLDNAIKAYRSAVALTYTQRELDEEKREIKRIQQEEPHLNNLDKIFSFLSLEN
jgi:tetratricopeptide (TPR) repeat protein